MAPQEQKEVNESACIKVDFCAAKRTHGDGSTYVSELYRGLSKRLWHVFGPGKAASDTKKETELVLMVPT